MDSAACQSRTSGARNTQAINPGCYANKLLVDVRGYWSPRLKPPPRRFFAICRSSMNLGRESRDGVSKKQCADSLKAFERERKVAAVEILPLGG